MVRWEILSDASKAECILGETVINFGGFFSCSAPQRAPAYIDIMLQNQCDFYAKADLAGKEE